jgi:hypothetical protein
MEMKTIINKSILSITAYYVNNENGFHSGRAQAMAECPDSSAYLFPYLFFSLIRLYSAKVKNITAVSKTDSMIIQAEPVTA